MSSKRSNSPLTYILGSFAVQGIAFFSTPILTRLLTPGDYGVIAIYSLWLSVFTIVIGLKTDGSVINASVEYGKDKLDGYISSIMTISIISFLLFLIPTLIFRNQIASLLNLKPTLVLILLVQSFFDFCISLMLYKQIALKQSRLYITISILNSFFSVALGIIWILCLPSDKYLGKIYGSAFVSILLGFLCLVEIYRKGRKIFSKSYCKFCLTLTVPVIFHNLSLLILAQSDRYMLAKMTNNTEVGIYSFAYTLGTVISVIWSACNNSWVPFYYENTKRGNKEVVLDVYRKYTFIFCLITIGFVFFAPEFIAMMGSSAFSSAKQITPIIAIGSFFIFMYSFPVNYEFYKRKTLFISIGSAGAAVINILLNFWFIPLYGSMGTAFSTLISYMILFIIHYLVSKFVIKGFQIPLGFLLLPITVVLLATGLFYLISAWLYLRWIVILIVGITFIIYTYKNYPSLKKQLNVTNDET